MNKGMNVRGEHPMNIRYVVEGRTYTSHRGVYREAVARGYVGNISTLAARLHSGASTWTELTRPVRTSKSRKETIEKKRAEMAEAIAQLDARKATLEEAA